jgi:hypothetical protein
MYPKDWKKYRDLVKQNRIQPVGGLNTFAARYRMAKSLEGINFKNIAQKTQDAYFAALRVQLVHNALESLSRAMGKNAYELEVFDSKLSKSFRSGTGIRFLSCLIDHTNEPLQSFLKKWIGNQKDHDLTRIAAATRHLHAHGLFTAYGCHVANSVRIQRMLNRLADSVFKACDRHFNAFVEEREH